MNRDAHAGARQRPQPRIRHGSTASEVAVTLHAEVSGSGPGLVLLHGWGMNSSVWREMAAALAPRFRVHCVDLPGHGLSPARPPFTLEAVTGALAACAPARTAVCGWSLGAQFALHWARRYPQQIEQLVLIAGTPRFVNGAGWSHGIDPAVLDAFAAGLGGGYGAALQRFLALQAQGDHDARTVLRRLRERVRLRALPDLQAAAAGLRILKESDLRDSLSEIAQPALLLHGEQDELVPLAASEFLLRMLPDARLTTIAGAAHAPFIAHLQPIASRIEEFCRGC